MAVYGPQRKLGYTDVVYNIKTGKFYAPVRGDNYFELDVQTGGGSGGGGTQTTATLPLANPTREGRADSSNLKTQADLNDYFNTWIQEVEASTGGGPGGTVDQLPPLQ